MVALVAALRTTTTSRSDPWTRALRPVVVLSLAIGVLFGCSRDRATREHRQDPIESSVAAPAGLIAEGVLADPARAFALTRATLADRGVTFPSSYALAVTTLAGIPPLVVGLVDETAPVSLVVTDVRGAKGVIAAVRVTNDEELVVALTHGADAAFRAEKGADAITLLRPKSGSGPVSLGVFRRRLLIGSTEAHVLDAARYLTGKATIATQPGSSLVLEIRKPALCRVFVPALKTILGRFVDDLRSADRAVRARHGGKEPDFGDPEAVLQTLSRVGDGGIALLETARMARLSAFVEPNSLRLRVELHPDDSGATRDAVARMPVGRADALLTLPASTRAVVLLRGLHPTNARGDLEAVLGKRLRGVDRACLERWVSSADRALGDVFEIGAYASSASSAAFVKTEHGNTEALRGTMRTLPEVLAIPAIAGPIETFYGRLRADAPRVLPNSGSSLEEIAFHVVARGRAGAEKFRVASGADLGTAAAVAGEGPADVLRELLHPRGPTIGAEPSVHDAVLRAGDQTLAAAAVRVWATGGQGPDWVVAFAGTDRNALWAEASGAPQAIAVLINRFAGP